jgi:hypothetical protein
MFVNEPQPEKALSPIDVTLFGSEISPYIRHPPTLESLFQVIDFVTTFPFPKVSKWYTLLFEDISILFIELHPAKAL